MDMPITCRTNLSEHVMIDLETMGTSANAPIIAIGACTMDGVHQFYQRVSLESSMMFGAKPDAPTILWWLQQSDAARAEFLNNDMAAPLDLALHDFSLWIDTEEVVPNSMRIWGNGANFDNIILSNAYKATGRKQPWQFYNDRCFRTVKNLYKHVPPPEFEGTKHNAIADALFQAAYIRKMMYEVGFNLS